MASGPALIFDLALRVAAMLPVCGCMCSDAPKEKPEQPTVETPTNEPWSDAWLIERGEQYLNNPEHRRTSMLKSLRNPKNLYSRQRIAAYGNKTRGWDALPVWNPRSEVLRLSDDAPPSARVWNQVKPQTMDAWRVLGKNRLSSLSIASRRVRCFWGGVQRENGTFWLTPRR